MNGTPGIHPDAIGDRALERFLGMREERDQARAEVKELRLRYEGARGALSEVFGEKDRAEAEVERLTVRRDQLWAQRREVEAICCDLEPYALPGDALQLARRVLAVYGREASARDPAETAQATVGPDAYPSEGGAVPEAPGANAGVGAPRYADVDVAMVSGLIQLIGDGNQLAANLPDDRAEILRDMLTDMIGYRDGGTSDAR